MTKILPNGSKQVVSLIDGNQAEIQRTNHTAGSTYAVGQENAITDMARAAMAGRGLFFNAKDGNDVVEAFDAIIARAAKSPQEQAATTGASGSSVSSKNAGNAYLMTRYDGNSFTGDLIKREIFNGENPGQCFSDYIKTDGNTRYETVLEHEKRLGEKHRKENKEFLGDFCDKSGWSAAEKLRDKDYDSRQIFTLKIKSSGSKLTNAALKTDAVNNQTLSYEVIDFADDAFKISETIAGNDTVSLYQRNQLLSGINNDEKTKRLFKRISTINSIAADNKKLAALFKYIRGSVENEQVYNADCKYQGRGIFRSRSQYHYDYDNPLPDDKCGTEKNILGALIRSSAVFAGKPNLTLSYLSKAGSAYQNYRNQVVAKYNDKTKKEVIYVNSNDGMLHAFDPENGDELFAYIPASIYSRLAQTVVPKKQLSLVDGKLTTQWVNTGSSTDNDSNDIWKQFLVSGFGGGGKGIFALDITSTTTIDGAWEYSDLQSRLYNRKKGNKQGKSNIGNIMWEPAIVQLQDNTWAMVTGNGYNSESGKAVLIVLDLVTGKPIQELELPNDLSNQPNGLSQLFFAGYPDLSADTPEKTKTAMKKLNVVDRAYAGDLQGNLWVFDFTNATKAGGITIDKNKPLFTAKATVDGDEVRLPITAKPLVMQHPKNQGHLVHFGTGALFSVHDLSSKVPNALYGIWDDWIPTDKGGKEHPLTSTVQENELNVITMIKAEKEFDGKTTRVGYVEAGNPTNWGTTERGWKINLTFNKEGSERVWQSPVMTYGASSQQAISYRTVRYLDNDDNKSQCGGGGAGVEGRELVFDPADAGKRLMAPVIDANGDGVVDEKDMMEVSDGNGGTVLIPINAKVTEGHFLTNPTTVPVTTRNVRACKLIVSSSTGSHSKTAKKAIPICSYVSSWKELREEEKK